MNYYAFHLGDYASATSHLTWEEDLAYRRLMDAYYREESPLPLEHRIVHRLVRAITDIQREAVDAVLQEFFEETSEGWRHYRCDAEIDAVSGKREKASKSAKARWEKANAMRPHSERNANAMPTQCERIDLACERIENECERNAPNPNPNPNPKEQKKAQTAKTTFSVKELVHLGVDEKHARDWIEVRRKKKAAMTETALNGVMREASKAGISLAEAIRICAEKNWQGFEAAWLTKSGNGSGFGAPVNKQQQIEEANARVVQEIIEREARRKAGEPEQQCAINLGEPITIEGEVLHAH